MMKVSEELDELWRKATLDIREKPGVYERRLSSVSVVPVYAGVNSPTRNRVLRIGFKNEQAVAAGIAHATRGYTVALHVKHSGDGYTFIQITERDISMPRDLFGILCSDICSEMSTAKSELEGGRILRHRLSHWRRFFAIQEEGLSHEEYVGLYAELEFMERILKSGNPPRDVIRAWTGPSGSNQDFTFGRQAVEIKGTTANDANVIAISSVRQLDDTGIAALYLTAYAYDGRRGSGRTAKDVAGGLHDLLGAWPDLQSEFAQKLEMVGPVDRGSNTDLGLTLRRARYYRIKLGFPRILEADLLPGVMDVRFAIDLSAASRFEVSESDVIGKVRGVDFDG
jgi:hypothetical protein